MLITPHNRPGLVAWLLPPLLFLIFLVLQFLLQGFGSASNSNYYDAPPFSYKGATSTNALNKEFFFEIPEAQINAALQLLGDKEVFALSVDQASSLLGREIHIDSMIEDLGRRVQLTAKADEVEATETVRKEDYEKVGEYAYLKALEYKQDLKRLSIIENEHAAHLSSLRGKLNPYLIKLGAQNRTVGQYRGWIDKGTLYVLNGLYQKTAEFRPYPVIVFLSVAPERLAEEISPIAP